MNRSFGWMSVVLMLARLAFGILFLCAAFSKIIDSDRFAQQVANYDIVGPQASAVVGAILPWAELTVGTCLVLRLWNAGAWLGTVLLYGCFVVARVSVLRRGLFLECGCGVMDGTITPLSLVISVASLATAIVGYLATLFVPRDAQPEELAQTHGLIPSCSLPEHLQPGKASPCV